MLHSCITAMLVALLLLAPPWTPPRTAWGDPDLQGTYTNNNEYATPLERPAEFEGKRAGDLTPAEIAEVRRLAQQRMINALPGGRVRGPDDWWLQNLDLSKRSRLWSIVDPPDGRIPPLTPAGAQRASGRVRSSFVGGPFDGPEDLNYLERCITRGVPGSMIPVMYSNNYEIVQAPGLVVIRYEIIHDTRIIPLDGRPHVGSKIGQHLGDARGHWEGSTLVVETTNFNDRTRFRNSTSALKVTERFTRTDAETVDYQFTVDDPNTWTRPWTAAVPLRKVPGPIYEYACHEGNYGLPNILRAQRVEDAKAAKGVTD